MPQQSIDMIREAEDKASAIRTAALDDAKAAVRKAEEEIAAWKDEQLKEIRHEAKGMIDAAEKDAQNKAEKANAKYEDDRKAFREKALKNMDKAVGIVVERIVKL